MGSDAAIFPDRLRLPFDFDPVLLTRDLARAAAGGWVHHYGRHYYEGEWDVIALRAPAGMSRPTQMIIANPMAETFADAPVLADCPYFRQVLARFACPLRFVRLMRLAPGSIIKEHADQYLDIEDGVVRLHVPVVTNEQVDFRLNGLRIDMAAGSAWYLRLGDPHSVANPGPSERVHLVIDAVLNQWLIELFATAEYGLSTAMSPR